MGVVENEINVLDTSDSAWEYAKSLVTDAISLITICVKRLKRREQIILI